MEPSAPSVRPPFRSRGSRGHSPLANDLPDRRPPAPTPLERLRGRRVRVRYLAGETAVGQLQEVARYELVVGIAPGRSIVIFKGAVQSIEECTS